MNWSGLIVLFCGREGFAGVSSVSTVRVCGRGGGCGGVVRRGLSAAEARSGGEDGAPEGELTCV